MYTYIYILTHKYTNLYTYTCVHCNSVCFQSTRETIHPASKYRALLIEYRAILIQFRALLMGFRVLLMEYRALLLKCMALLI